MKKDLVIKSNTLVEACFNLSLAEYRILNMAFAEMAEYESGKVHFHQDRSELQHRIICSYLMLIEPQHTRR